jgi:hypothetical protein
VADDLQDASLLVVGKLCRLPEHPEHGQAGRTHVRVELDLALERRLVDLLGVRRERCRQNPPDAPLQDTDGFRH